MVSETQEQDKQISSYSDNSIFDSVKLLLSDFRKELPGYVKIVIQEILAETPQYDDTDKVSLLAPTDEDLGSQQQADSATDA